VSNVGEDPREVLFIGSVHTRFILASTISSGVMQGYRPHRAVPIGAAIRYYNRLPADSRLRHRVNKAKACLNAFGGVTTRKGSIPTKSRGVSLYAKT
jgi:hypothetical protein